jgi:hypothetical protein
MFKAKNAMRRSNSKTKAARSAVAFEKNGFRSRFRAGGLGFFSDERVV